MVKLEKMTIEQYYTWQETKIKFYAEEKVQVGNVSAEKRCKYQSKSLNRLCLTD